MTGWPPAGQRAARYPLPAGMVDDAARRHPVAVAVSRLRAGELAKVVLARDPKATASEPLDERCLRTRLAGNYPDCRVFAVNGLIGATPELLPRREYAAHPGCSRTARAEKDRRSALARELLTSAKNRAERSSMHVFARVATPSASRPDNGSYVRA